MTERKESLVIYHENCADGFTAAWAFWTVFGDEAEYLPAQYGDEPPEMVEIVDREVYIVDFSYPREVLEWMHGLAKKLVVLDHHKTAEKNLAGLDYCEFDMTRSGAMMAWDYVVDTYADPSDYVGHPAPNLVKYVQDRDLWTWELTGSKEISAYIGTLEFDFLEWDCLRRELEKTRLWERIYEKGQAIVAYRDQLIASVARKAYRAEIAGHDVPIVNAPSIIRSELGNVLTEGELFAGVWYIDPEVGAIMSLRSNDDSAVDVSEIAEQFGGGGHPNAAGFTFDPREVDFIYPSEKK